MDPYRDDRDARIEELERRLVAAESALRRAETRSRKLLRTTVHGSVLAAWFLGSLAYAVAMIVAAIGGAGTAVHAVGAILSAGMAFLVAVVFHMRSAPDEILVIRGKAGGLEFIGPDEEADVGRRRVQGALPAGRTRVDVSLARHAITAFVSIGADPERRRDAVPRFLDRTLDDVAAEAAPIVDAVARKVLAQRGDGAPLDRLSADIKLSVQSALRDVGLEVGELVLVPVT